MKIIRMCALAAVMVSATGTMAAGTETVYQRTQTNGAVSLTNMPEGDGYQVLVAGARPDAAAAGAENLAAAGSSQSAGRNALGRVSGAPEEQPVDPIAPRMAETPPSMEARTGKLLDPDVAVSMASAQAQQAQDEITSAGGAQARLQSLYKASVSAFQSRQVSQPGHR